MILSKMKVHKIQRGAKKKAGLSLLVVFVMSTILNITMQLTTAPTAHAYDHATDVKRRFLIYFAECLTTEDLDYDGRNWDGDNKAIEFESTQEMFKKGERIAVGIDMEPDNGIRTCYTIYKNVMEYNDYLGWGGTADYREQRLQSAVWGKSIRGNGGALKVGDSNGNDVSPGQIKLYAAALRKKVLAKADEYAKGYTKRTTLERFIPLFKQCFNQDTLSNSLPNRNFEDGSLKYSALGFYAERNVFDWKDVKKPRITGNDGRLSLTRAQLGDIELDFSPGATTDAAPEFDSRWKHWFPVGNDLPTLTDSLDSAIYEGQVIASCQIFNDKKSFFFGSSKTDTKAHYIIKDGELKISEDTNNDGTIDDTEIEAPTTTITTDDGSADDSSDSAQCIVNPPLSWILCPLITVGVETVEWLEGQVTDALQFPPLSSNGNFTVLYDTWGSFKNLANAALVLIFLVMIFAQVLPIEVDPYMAKKILPRLIAAAIFIQFSYFFVQILVDITNVLAGGVSGIIGSVSTGSNGGGFWGAGGADGMSVFGSMLAIAGGTAGIAAAVSAGAALIVPVLLLLLSAAISILTLFVTLEVRIVLIIVYTMVAPLAILAWVLPNTENYFKKWLSTLFKLLLMYPIIVFMVQGTGLIVNVAQDATAAIPNGGATSLIFNLLVSIIPIIIFFMIPATFKWAGGMFATVSGAIQNQGNSWSKRARSGSLMKNSLENIKQKTGEKLADTDKFTRSDLLRPKKYFGGLQRLGARTATGNAFSFGKTGERKVAQTANAAKHARLEAQSGTIKELNASNAVIGEMISAKLAGESSYTYKDRDGHEKTVKLTDDMVAGGLRYLNENSGQLEIAKLGAGKMKYKDAKGNDAGAAPAIYDSSANGGDGAFNTIRGFKMGELIKEASDGNTAALLKAAPHMVHGAGAAVYEQATAEMISGMKGPAMDVAAEVIAADSTGASQARLADSLVGIMNSSDKAGKIDKATAMKIKELVTSEDAVGSQMIDLNGDGNAVRLDSVIDQVITSSGTVLFNDAARRG